jgi:hypothetical protein
MGKQKWAVSLSEQNRQLRKHIAELKREINITNGRLQFQTELAEEFSGRIAELEDHLRAILPMAKGYAAHNPVGRNQEMISNAESALQQEAGE